MGFPHRSAPLHFGSCLRILTPSTPSDSPPPPLSPELAGKMTVLTSFRNVPLCLLWGTEWSGGYFNGLFGKGGVEGRVGGGDLE